MTTLNAHLPMVLIILDGWGYRATLEDNAIAAANKPNWDQLINRYPSMLIDGSGHAVGLPDGQMGNSEVGHLNLGAGRTVYQDFTRIDHAISNGTFYQNPVLLQALQKAKAQQSAVHIMGLMSPGGVHSHENHIHAVCKLAAEQGVQRLYLHAFLDGRDTPPKSALETLKKTDAFFHEIKLGRFASIIGRYYAMDRDKRWDRTQIAYDLITDGKAPFTAVSASEALLNAYNRGETDEFVKATSIHSEGVSPVQMHDDDVVIFMNFRADRVRQLTHALIDDHFEAFFRSRKIKLSQFVTLTEYADHLGAAVAFPPERLNHILAQCIAEQGMKQLRVAETEKYAHVTFFFNGGIEKPFPGEERILVPSPKVATYDLQPAMSAFEVAEQVVFGIQSKKYALIICNFANADMVGHSGNFAATVEAIEVIDQCLGKIITALNNAGGEAIITADHGNAEMMFDQSTHQAHTAHTTQPVPFIYIGRNAVTTTEHGTLSDIAPTMLYLMNLPIPKEMTGHVLLKLT